MTTRRLILSACVLCTISTALVASSQAAKPRVKLAPPIPCTMSNHLDIFVDEDSILWACECEVIVTIFACHWQVIGGVESTSIRKFRKHHPRRAIAYAKAPVIA